MNLALLFFHILKYAFQVPYLDSWDVVNRMSSWLEDDLAWRHFFHWYGSHRSFFPRLVETSMALQFGWNLLYHVWFNVFLSGLACFLFLRWVCASRTCFGSAAFQIALTACVLFVFSGRPSVNWLWGEKIVGFMSTLGAVFGFFMLSSERVGPGRFLSAAFAGIVATYSFSSGTAFWPAAFFMLLFKKYESAAGRFLTLSSWFLVSFAVLRVFVEGYTPQLGVPPPEVHIAADPGRFLSFIPVYLGAVIVGPEMPFQITLAFGCGIAGLSLFTTLIFLNFIYCPASRPALSAFAGPGVYVILNAVLTASGRGASGPGWALNDQLATTSYLFWLSLMLVGLLTFSAIDITRFPRQKNMKNALAVVCVIIFISALAASVGSLGRMKQLSRKVKMTTRGMLEGRYENVDKALQWTGVEQKIRFLKEHHLTIMSDDEALQKYIHSGDDAEWQEGTTTREKAASNAAP